MKFLLLETASIFHLRPLAFKVLKRLISGKFPTVKWITTQKLARWLADPLRTQPIILDARSEAEYDLSHLNKAQRIDPKLPDLSPLLKSPDQPIVVYCSVGYRSARIAERLQQAGCSCVYNLEGSLFKWANEGRPVFKDDCLTAFVHPYDAAWGKLLKSEYHGQPYG